MPQKEAALLPLVRRSTRCIAGAVVSDPRYRPDLRRDQVTELIADALNTCVDALDDLVDAHDRMYGNGSGEAYVLGPYFDALPAAVLERARTRVRANSQ